MRTLSFTEAEKARIEKAAKICGWQNGESATFARTLLLRTITLVLRSSNPRRGDVLLQRLRSLSYDAPTTAPVVRAKKGESQHDTNAGETAA